MMKKYSVNDAIWIATALLAAEEYSTNADCSAKDMYFKQSVILHKAEELTDGTVDAARISWSCCADNERATHNYLRGDLPEDESLRRLTCVDEFADKTYPDDLDLDDELTMNGRPFTMDELMFFVREQYPEIMKDRLNETSIDYIGVLDYLKDNAEVPYSNPEDAGISFEEKKRLLKVKEKGQAAVSEMKKMTDAFKKTYELNYSLPILWLDGSNTKTKKKLWAQMKYSDYKDNPISISIFVEKSEPDSARYRVSLEIKNDGADKETMVKYHSHLDLPCNKEAGLFYASGSDKWGRPDKLTGTQEAIKAKVKSGELRKVQICKIIERIPDETNEYYHDEISKAIAAIVPYYKYVLGIESDEYWPSLNEYDPGISKDDWLLLLKDPQVTHYENLVMFKMMLLLGGESTCSNLAERYGGTPATYNSYGNSFSERVHRKTGCKLCPDGDKERVFTIPFRGRYVIEKGNKRYSWKLRDELKEALEEMDLSNIEVTVPKVNTTEFDKNLILYGPPGTGKTYSLAIYAVSICDEKKIEDVKSLNYEDVMERYHELLNEGRVSFTTFHQSYGYEEFIEGIKPVVDEAKNDIGYTIESGVFKRFCERATKPSEDYAFTGNVWNVRNRAGDKDIFFDLNEYIYSNGVIMVEDIEDSNRQCDNLSKMAKGDLVILGRNYHIDAIGIVDDFEPTETECSPFHWKRNVQWLSTHLNKTFSDIGKSGMAFSNFSISKSPLKAHDLYSLFNLKKESKPFVFIIDEINRGNISKIFGELITLIENTKRAGMSEAASATLPYSGESFSVPSNVYILGTMNTADRSIALMDTALRRRFQFKEMMPDSNVLRNIGADRVSDGVSELDVAAMLETINERITFLYDREHTIGHAFFTGLAHDSSIEKLASIFSKSVIPLLQEYFYEDYQKIQLVLGDNAKVDDDLKFIKDVRVIARDVFKGNVDEVIDLPEKKYVINEEALMNIQSYIQIM